MKVTRDVEVPTWNAEAATAGVDYLRRRGFCNAQLLADLLVIGNRGSLWGNLTSFDMTKLRAVIRLSSNRKNHVFAELLVDTFAQQITEWNLATWRLEMAELHRVVCGVGHLEGVWDRFQQESRAAGRAWTKTLGREGAALPEAWEREIRHLEAWTPDTEA